MGLEGWLFRQIRTCFWSRKCSVVRHNWGASATPCKLNVFGVAFRSGSCRSLTVRVSRECFVRKRFDFIPDKIEIMFWRLLLSKHVLLFQIVIMSPVGINIVIGNSILTIGSNFKKIRKKQNTESKKTESQNSELSWEAGLTQTGKWTVARWSNLNVHNLMTCFPKRALFLLSSDQTTYSIAALLSVACLRCWKFPNTIFFLD